MSVLQTIEPTEENQLNYKNNVIYYYDVTETWEPSDEQEILMEVEKNQNQLLDF